MMRFNGLLPFNSFISGGEFIQPHFQKRQIFRYLLLKTPLGGHEIDEIHDQLPTYSPLLYLYIIKVQIHIFE
jgi:hypothetical protein